MKRIIPILLVALGFNLGIGLAALDKHVYLPAIANGQATTTITTLVDFDSVMVTAYVLPNTSRIILTYIDRAHGNVLHVVEDKGNRVAEIPLPPGLLTAQQVDPSFTYPGPKQSNGATVVTGNVLHVYACTRDIGDLTGPFKLKRIDMPVPAPAP